jgi:hypothetical protein
MSIKLVFSDKIEFKPIFGQGNSFKLECFINNEYYHCFNGNSKMVRLLNSTPIEELTEQFTGAPFIFANLSGEWELVDYRDKDYKGFIQSTENMKYFMEHIGFNKSTPQESTQLYGDIRQVSDLFKKHRLNKQGFDFCGEAKSFNFDVNGLNEGGDFEAQLRFSWSPFESTVGSKVELQRLICLNGMVAMTPLLDNQIRIVNNLEEHLRIAQSLIGDNLQAVLSERLEQMTLTRASVYQAMGVFQHSNIRLINPNNKDQTERLKKIAYMANPRLHISQNSYKEKVFFDDNLAQLAPSHLTKFDVWNMLTEIDTYTKETYESSSLAIQRSINRLMFEESTTVSPNMISKTNINVVADHNRAFFGNDSNGF